MPRLFDLLSDDSRKDLIAEKRKKQSAQQKSGHRKGKHTPRSKPVHQHRPTIHIPDFVALDVETTGLLFKSDRIIEIGAVKFNNGKETETFSTFINPGIPVPPAITDLTGITNEDLKDAPDFESTAGALLDFIGSLPLCGHQIEFDATFLKEELKRLKQDALKNQWIDTALLSRILLDPRGRFSLKYVSESLNVTLDNAHRALHDARASGEIALALLPKLAQLPDTIRRTVSACAPGSLLKTLVYKTLDGQKPGIEFAIKKEKPLSRLVSPDETVPIQRNAIAELFSEQGGLAGKHGGFTPRAAQQKMARGVTDALNTQSFYIAEAGTGTGKSLAYLVPAACWALENGTRVIISTRTRNLQDQLLTSDLPLATAVSGGDLKYTVLKGRRNYLCIHRFRQLLSGTTGNLSPRERFAVLPLVVWSHSTETGDIEEQNQFNPRWFSKIWNLISAEHHECGGRRCPQFSTCFFQRARNRALGSHIVIINHALFFSDICSESSFLGAAGPIIFDEAHHLESSGHRFLRVEIDTNRINLFTEIINNLVIRLGTLKDEKKIYERGKTLRTSLKRFRKISGEFLATLTAWAKEHHPQTPDYQLTCREEQFAALPATGAFTQGILDINDDLIDCKHAIKGHPDAEEFESYELETQACIERASQLKADAAYLIAAKTEEHVFWVEGNHGKGWSKLCGVPLDVGALLSEIWELMQGAVIFTSATLSIAESFDYFKRTTGVAFHEERTTADLFKSPFSGRQTIAGAVRQSPLPDAPDFPDFVGRTIIKLHTAYSKNILVLFTANSMLSAVYTLLRDHSSIAKQQLLSQGSGGSRQILLEEFKKGSGMILLGTDSFWEGIDVPGEACEIVVIPRLPFPVPSHPLTQAIAQRMQQKTGESFFSYSVPEAVIKFRQGAGRLIRSASDRGALMVLDNRIVTKGYGRQFIRSLDTPVTAFETAEDFISSITAFFASDNTGGGDVAETTYVPLEDV
jgi:ATP-dependent DNA helicase DinG